MALTPKGTNLRWGQTPGTPGHSEPLLTMNDGSGGSKRSGQLAYKNLQYEAPGMHEKFAPNYDFCFAFQFQWDQHWIRD